MSSSELECIMQCSPGALMTPIDPTTYIPARQVMDGTLKWFECLKCGGVFCLDKISRTWQFAPETYTDLVEEGLLLDKLKD